MNLINGDEFFFRAADRELCDNVCTRIAREGMSLALIGSSSAAIEHYARVVVKRLRAMADLRVEVHLPTTTEQLIERFNDILKSMSMTDAMGERSADRPVRILVSGDTNALDEKEGRLLARLVNNFPGANTQLILLHDDHGERGDDQPLDLFGKRLLRWYVRPPSRTEAMDLLLAAGPAGVEHEVMQLLDRINPLFVEEGGQRTSKAPAAVAAAPVSAAAAAPAAAGPREPVMREVAVDVVPEHGTPLTPPPMEKPPRPPSGALRQFVRILTTGIVMAAVSAAIVTVIFPQHGVALLDLFQANPPVAAPTPAPAPVEPTVVETVIDEVVPASAPPATTAAAPASSDAEAKPEAGIPRLEAVVSKVDTPPREPAKPEAKAEGARPEPAKPAPVATEATRDAKETKAAKAEARQLMPGAVARVKATPRDQYFVQSVALDTFDLAAEWRAARPALSQAMIVPVLIGDGTATKYVVISGPFKTRGAAADFAKNKDVPADRWLRQAASLQAVLAAEPAAPAKPNKGR